MQPLTTTIDQRTGHSNQAVRVLPRDRQRHLLQKWTCRRHSDSRLHAAQNCFPLEQDCQAARTQADTGNKRDARKTSTPRAGCQHMFAGDASIGADQQVHQGGFRFVICIFGCVARKHTKKYVFVLLYAFFVLVLCEVVDAAKESH
jgi:hypothetical protein